MVAVNVHSKYVFANDDIVANHQHVLGAIVRLNSMTS